MRLITKPRSVFVRSAIAACTLAAAAASQAAVYDFYDGSALFATMTTSGGTTFSLQVASSINSAAYIDYLNLAGPGGTFSYGSAGVATLTGNSYSAGGFVDQGSQYNWQLQWANSNANGGAARLTGGETVTWSITVTDPSAWNFNLLHVNAYDGRNSIKLSGCERSTAQPCTVTQVPEPGSLALVGLALAAGGLVLRRSRQAAR